MDAAQRPVPSLDPENRPFWDHAMEGRLALQGCKTCGHLQFPPGPVCAECLGTELSWHPVSGEATLLSWAEFHRAYWPGFADRLPYTVCLVRLREGPLLVSNLAAGTDGLALDMPLRVRFERLTDDIKLPVFGLAQAAAS